MMRVRTRLYGRRHVLRDCSAVNDAAYELYLNRLREAKVRGEGESIFEEWNVANGSSHVAREVNRSCVASGAQQDTVAVSGSGGGSLCTYCELREVQGARLNGLDRKGLKQQRVRPAATESSELGRRCATAARMPAAAAALGAAADDRGHS
jgi:hypothetical protein